MPAEGSLAPRPTCVRTNPRATQTWRRSPLPHQRKAHAMTPPPNTAGAERAVWSPCATCWGQRRIYEDRNGEGLVPLTCPTCLGLGEELKLDAAPAVRAVGAPRSR